MDYKFFLNGITGIVLNPSSAWDTIDSDNKTNTYLRNNLLLPLIILVSVFAFIGSVVFTNSELSIVYSIFVCIKTFVLLFSAIYSISYILGEITFPLDLGKDFKKSFTIIVYSTVPFLLCQTLSQLFESLLFTNILALFGLYIFWTGTTKMLSPPHYKKMPMLIATFVIYIGIYVTINFFLSMVTDKIYFAYFA